MNTRRIGAHPKESFWSGLKGGIFDAKHTKAMGSAIWLFGYLCMRQTQLNESGEGLPRYGNPISRADITGDTGWTLKQIEHWTAKLVGAGYIRVKRQGNDGLVFFIQKAKNKHKVARTGRPDSGRPDRQLSPDLGDFAPRSPKSQATCTPNSTENQGVTPFPTKSPSYSDNPSSLQHRSAAENAAPSLSSLLKDLGKKKAVPSYKASQAQIAERERLLSRQRQEILSNPKYSNQEDASPA